MAENYVQWYAGDIFELILGQEIGTSDLTLMSLPCDDDWTWTCLIKDHRATCDHLCTHVDSMISGWYTFSCHAVHSSEVWILKICWNCWRSRPAGISDFMHSIHAWHSTLHTSLFVSCQWYCPMCKHTSCAIISGLEPTEHATQWARRRDSVTRLFATTSTMHQIKVNLLWFIFATIDQINPKFAPPTTFSLLFF